MNSLNKKIIELKTSPTFAMSLGGKELFHSNFWAWLIEYGERKFSGDNPFAQIFFKDLKGKYNLTVSREKANRDISISHTDEIGKKHVYVIENKLKSISTLDQLIRYQSNLKDNFAGGILTGITNDIDLSDTCWTFLSYKEISSKLKKIVINDTSFEATLIKQYATDIKNLSDIFSELLDISNHSLPTSNEEISKRLGEIRFADVFIKKQAHNFESFLLNDKKFVTVKNIANDNGLELQAKVDFSHKNATIDVFLKEASGLRIGIQIQGSQYRRFVEIPEKNQFQNVFNDFNGKWFTNYNKEKQIFGHPTSMSKEFGRFGPNSFVYQYYTLSADNLKFDILKNSILEDIKLGINITKS